MQSLYPLYRAELCAAISTGLPSYAVAAGATKPSSCCGFLVLGSSITPPCNSTTPCDSISTRVCGILAQHTAEVLAQQMAEILEQQMAEILEQQMAVTLGLRPICAGSVYGFAFFYRSIQL
jgi:hypothetical protein